MIITKLIGGLGNQLFQYAIGRHLALIHRTELKFDVSGFETCKLNRKYSLWPFNILENFAETDEIAKFKENKINILIDKFKPFYKRSLIKERANPYFIENALKVSNNIYLEGYWQTEKYFKDIEDVIRHEYTLKNKMSNENIEMERDMINVNSVSLHIRRGDYASDKNTGKTHPVCSLEYYRHAVEKISKSVSNPVFFIFSDDIEWVRSNLKLNYVKTFVSGNGMKDFEELILMSKCNHNIIANSSFSWWGAWLNANKNKVVIAPKKWFGNSARNTKDLIPELWIKI